MVFTLCLLVAALLMPHAVLAQSGSEDVSPQQQAALQRENDALRREVKRLARMVSGGQLMEDESRRLRERLITLENERSRLMNENQNLRSWRERAKWLGGMLLIGIVLGYLLAKRSQRVVDFEEL